MTDVENTFRAELNRMLAVDATPDWDAILVAADVQLGAGQRRQRRLAVAFAALLAAAAVALVTPLGGAIARGLEEFSTWLTRRAGNARLGGGAARVRRGEPADVDRVPGRDEAPAPHHPPRRRRRRSSCSASAPGRAGSACG